MDTGRRKLGRALAASVTMHAGLALAVIVLLSVSAGRVAPPTPPLKLTVFYLPASGPPGGGGGNPAPAPPRPLEVPHHQEPAPVPVVPVPVVPEPPPELRLDAPVETTAARVLQFFGSSATALAAPGGNGPGTGAGPGAGSGLGPGLDAGVGGGPRGGGGDPVPPSPIRSVQPTYTSEAMQAKIQGRVELEVMVLTNGTVGDVRITQSLDRMRGLDVEAVKAARQWLFCPGTRGGQPVDVLVKLILDFVLH